MDDEELESKRLYFARLGLTFCVGRKTSGNRAHELWGLEYEGRSYRILTQFERILPDGFAYKWEKMLR